jgi:hypothetical protein
MLPDNGDDINANDNQAALLCTTTNGHEAVAQLLLGYGVDITTKDVL